MEENEDKSKNRREFIRDGARGAGVVGLAVVVGSMVPKGAKSRDRVWQINPHKCTECGRCETHCVVKPSAVKSVHVPSLCGYCDLCTAYFKPEPFALNKGAENHMCPTDAILRKHVGEPGSPYFEYEVKEEQCVGCAKCVDGCRTYGNGSMQLQIRHDICVDCDSCSIAMACPSDAFIKVPADNPYLFKSDENKWYRKEEDQKDS